MTVEEAAEFLRIVELSPEEADIAEKLLDGNSRALAVPE